MGGNSSSLPSDVYIRLDDHFDKAINGALYRIDNLRSSSNTLDYQQLVNFREGFFGPSQVECDELLRKYKWTPPLQFPKMDSKMMQIPHMCEVMNFYNAHVPVQADDWLISQLIVNHALRILETMTISHTHFNCMKIYKFLPSGSACEGLKVEKAEEFDVLVPFDIVDEEGVSAIEEVTKRNNNSIPEGWVEFKLTTRINPDRSRTMTATRRYNQIVEDNKLLPNGVRESLFKSVIRQALNKYEEVSIKHGQPNVQINLQSLGPAVTLNIKYSGKQNLAMARYNRVISVDLVPAINIQYKLPHQVFYKSSSNLLAVAKACKDGDYVPHLLWRLSFSKIEQQLIQELSHADSGNNCATAVLQIYKALQRQDVNRIASSEFSSKVASYYLKTLLFQMTFPYDKNAWTTPMLPRRLREFTKSLINALDRQNIPSAFFANKDIYSLGCGPAGGLEQVNLLQNVSPSTVTNMKYAVCQCLYNQNFQWMLSDETSEETSKTDRILGNDWSFVSVVGTAAAITLIHGLETLIHAWKK